MALVLINDETGEVVTTLEIGDSITRKNSIDALLEMERAPKDEYFSKLYHETMPKLIETSLTSAEIMMFLYLGSNLRLMSNVAKYRNGNLITRSVLQEKLNLSERTVKSSIYRLIKEGLIVEANTIEGRVFIVNPYVITVGDRLNKTVYDLFRKSKWARW
jgi:biotin operon repressor